MQEPLHNYEVDSKGWRGTKKVSLYIPRKFWPGDNCFVKKRDKDEYIWWMLYKMAGLKKPKKKNGNEVSYFMLMPVWNW